MVKPFLLIFLIVQVAWAQDCQGLREGEVLRLNVENKSLAQFKTQDQDGLGTCASNATSLLLHSVLPDNPDLSYLHLASIYKRSELNAKREEQLKANDGVFDVYAKKNENSTIAINPNRTDAEKWDLGIDGANVCHIISLVKEYQETSPREGVCKKDRMNLEKMAGGDDKDWLQRKSVLAVSQYMNKFQQQFSEAMTVKENPHHNKLLDLITPKKYTESEVKKNAEARKKYEDFKVAFESLLNNNEVINIEACRKIGPDVFEPINQKMATHFLRHNYCFDGATHPEYTTCKFFKKYMTVENIPGGGQKVHFTPEYITFLSNYMTGGGGDLSASDFKTKLSFSMQSLNGEPFNQMESGEVNEALNLVNDELINRAVTEINEIKKFGYSHTCRERKMMNYLASERFMDDVKQDQTLCHSSGIMEHVGSVISSTAMSGISDLSRVKDFLLNSANLNFDQAMLGLYAYDCDAADKVRIPANLSCSETYFSGTPKDQVNQLIVQEIKNNRALTMTMCAAILSKPKSEFASDECGRHAVGVIGVKCSGAKLKYLIQNSWGINSKARNPAIENAAEGKGAYWLDETSFFDGGFSLQSVGRQ